ncbi:MAG: spermidine synthase [Acidobacteria bacterium]|nr:spermidine synthase [Acidobacteriota bacterium]
MKRDAATSHLFPAAGLSLIFFLSGAAALIFEALWFHQAGLALGNSVWASSLVLAGFMGGLALGNGLVGYAGHRLARPLRAYGVMEIAVGMTGLGLVYLLPALIPLLAPWLGPLAGHPLALNTLRLGVAFVLLLVPATAMGATLPLVVSALHRRDPRFGRVLGRLYGWNTLGAVAGVVVAEILLLPVLGVRGSGWLAAGLDLLAAAGAFVLARAAARTPVAGDGATPVKARTGNPLGRRGWGLLAATFICGGILLALEVVWFRFLQLFVLGTGLAFALMLAVVLAGIALGGLLGSVWLSRGSAAVRQAPVVALVSGTTVVGVYLLLDPVMQPFQGEFLQAWDQILMVALPLMLPVSLLSGLIFTLLGDALNTVIASSTRAAGYLTLANTTGAMLGSALAGLVLLPSLGMEHSLRGLAAGYGVAALCMLLAGTAGLSAGRWLRRPLPVMVVAGFLLAVLFFPAGLLERRYLDYPTAHYRSSEGAQVVAVREGLTETIILMEVKRFGETLYHRLITNAYSMSATTYPSQRYMALFVDLPMVLRPQASNALLISYGVGVTARALVNRASLAEIDVVDTSRDILEMSRRIYPGAGENPLLDPRVKVHVEDGRFFLQTTGKTYDIITGEPPPPRMAGIINLYTREYFHLLAGRLKPGGLATYWLPVHSLHPDETRAIMAAFCDAFPDCTLWSGAGWDWLLAGSRGGMGRGDAEAFSRPWADPIVGPELRRMGVERPEQMGALFLADAVTLKEWIGGVTPLDDDHPRRLRSREPEMKAVYEAYRTWTDADAARRRFAGSPWVRQVWPQSLIGASLPYFSVQRDLNRLMFGEISGLPDSLPAVHGLLTETDLRTMPLLLLGTDPQALAAADRAQARGVDDAGVTARLGLRALAHRDLPGATARLTAAWQQGDHRASTAWALLYVLCRNGQIDQAAAFASGSDLAADDSAGGRRALNFLAARFGLQVAAGDHPGGAGR